MEYGTYRIKLWRAYNVKAKQYIHGMSGYSQQQLTIKLNDWICNEYCEGASLPYMNEAEKKQYNKVRRQYRLRQVQVTVADNFEKPGQLVAYAF